MTSRLASSALVAIGVLVASASMWAQAGAPVRSPRAWPPPPEQARVRFVRVLDPVSAQGRPSLVTRFFRAIVGGGDTPEMRQPYGVAVGPDGRLYVADSLARVIHVYDMVRPDYSTIRVDGESLIGIAVADGRIYVTDSIGAQLICLDARGRRLWTLGRREGFQRPTGVVVAGDRLHVIDTARHRVVTVSRTGVVLGGFGSHGSAEGQFNLPTNIARGSDGRLYVTDTMNFRLQVFDADGRFLRAFGKLGDGSGDFNRPKGVAVDREGHIYVVEGLHDVVQIFDERGALLLGFGESGTGDGQFWLPTGITIANDAIYVADSANKRIGVFQYLGDTP